MLERHELSALWGDVPDEEHLLLVEDMRDLGYLGGKIVLLEGKVLDGWHRFTAALDANLPLHHQEGDDGCGAEWLRMPDGNFLSESIFEDFTKAYPSTDPVDFVISLNGRRRHLTPKARAAAVLAARKWGNPEFQGTSNEQMASEAAVSESTLHRVKRELREQNGDPVPPHGTGSKQLDVEDIAKPGSGSRTVGAFEPTPISEGDDSPAPESPDVDWKQEFEKVKAELVELRASTSLDYVRALEASIAEEKSKAKALAAQVDSLKSALKAAEKRMASIRLAGDVRATLAAEIKSLRTSSGRLVPKSGEAGVAWGEKLVGFINASEAGTEGVVDSEGFADLLALLEKTQKASSRRAKDKVWAEGLIRTETFVSTLLENLST